MKFSVIDSSKLELAIQILLLHLVVLLLPRKEVTLRLLIHSVYIFITEIVVQTTTLLGILGFGVERLECDVVHVVQFICYFDVVSEFDAFTLAHLGESRCDLFDDLWCLQLVQLEQHVRGSVLAAFSLQFANVVVEIVFLVSAECGPHIGSNGVHILVFKYNLSYRQCNNHQSIQNCDNAVPLNQ